MGKFEFLSTPIVGVTLVQRQPIEDSRGFLSRMYCMKEFETAGLHTFIAQINHTRTNNKGAVRGMHFQYPPHSEIKMVSCLRGEVFDVVVDVRKHSSTFLQWHGEILSSANHRSLLIPEGCAHGFQTLTEHCELMYLHTAAYHPEAEGGLNPNDPRLAIAWPLEISQISARDQAHPFLTADFEGIEV